MEKVYNKLVRDNIPSIIEKNCQKSVTRILDEIEYRDELYKKLLEEANEVIDSKTLEETMEELADVLEIINSIAKANDKCLEDVIEIAEKKKIKRGGFEKRIFLEKVYI